MTTSKYEVMARCPQCKHWRILTMSQKKEPVTRICRSCANREAAGARWRGPRWPARSKHTA